MLFLLFFQSPILFAIYIVVLVVSIGVHEFAHVYAAKLQGDNTGQQLGRLTLNPLAHIDAMGLLFLLLAGFGWGKPAPYNPYNLKYKKYGSVLVTLAGPVSNLIIIIIATLALKGLIAFTALGATNLLLQFLLVAVQMNIILMVFNIIPIPPLDGSGILFPFLTHPRWNDLKMTLNQHGQMILIGLIILERVTGIGFFGPLFNFVFNVVGNFLV